VVEINTLGLHYRFSDKELKMLLQRITILVDSREQQNQHIIEYFDSKKIPYKSIKLGVGDYSILLPGCPELGIIKDMHLPIAIERKNSVDELVQTIKDRTRFENELIRSQRLRFTLLVEDANGYENILRGNYRSQYEPKSFLASLKSFETKYGFSTVYIPKRAVGNFLYHELYYFARNFLKGEIS
jgi:ERCC4-type nuclease